MIDYWHQRGGVATVFSLCTLVLLAGVRSAPAQEPLPGTASRRVVERLQAHSECSAVEPGVSIGYLSWDTREIRRGRHSVEVTPYRNGFDRSEYQTIAIVPWSQSTIEWREGEPGINYYWRIVTQQADKSYVSEVARFQPEVCPVDWDIREQSNEPEEDNEP